MTTDTDPTAAVTARAQARAEVMFRTAVTAAVGVVCIVVSVLAAGRTGLWGSLVGVVLVLAFFGSSAWVMTRTRPLEPALVLVIALGLYLLKMVGLAIVVIMLSALGLLGDPLHRVALALTIIAGALTWSSAEIVTAVRRRQPLFDVGRQTS